MVIHKPAPQFRIVTSYGGSNYTFTNDQFPSGQIIRVENGFDTATLWCNDWQSINWLAKMDADKAVTIEFKDASETTWIKVFDGIIRFIDLPSSSRGDYIELKCDGKGYGFAETICFSEFGTDSSKATLNSIHTIITTATTGIVDGYVNNMFTDNVTDSGFSYTANDTTVEDIVGEIKYLKFPGVPNSKALKDLCDVVQAIKGTNAGPHWIVDTSGNLLLCIVNTSHPDAANNGWYKYYGNSQANATLAQDVDFTEYSLQKMAKEANYVLYHGACVYPTTGDWCENNSAAWGKTSVDQTLSDNNTIEIVGSYCIEVSTTRNDGANLTIHYPDAEDLSLDVTKLGGRYNHPTLEFYARKNVEITNVGLQLTSRMGTADPGYWLDDTLPMIDDKWIQFSIPVGPYAVKDNWDHIGGAATAPIWTDVDSIQFWLTHAANANDKYFYVDGLHFSGSVLRGARQAAAYSSTDPMKVKVIHDNVAKGDTLSAADDSGTIARMAYAELLRAKGTPIVGWIKTPLIKDLLPGQILHIHAKKKADGTFNIDKDMRAVQVTHNFGEFGYNSVISLTDDVANSYARTSFSDVNIVLKASREYEDRQAMSAKLGEIDVTQTILEKPY